MKNVSQPQSASAMPRTFARLTAMEVTQAMDEENKKGLFLTVVTDPDRPEPEHFIL